MSTLTIIKPTETEVKSESDLPLNVCAYCRVSTDENDQKNSLHSQRNFFDTVFLDHPTWRNVGVFYDEGVSGTSLNKRDSFNEMIRKARRGEIDLIYTKEVSRFGRNVQDVLNIVEELRNLNVYVVFLTDDINTQKSDYREKLTQAANSAELESHRTSKRVRWGQQQQMKKGVVFGRKEMFGYNIKRNGKGEQYFEIIEEEAEIVRMIFEWFSNGDGTHTISNKLQELGIKTKRYKNGWSNIVILRLLRNEKYVGDLRQGKTYTENTLSHKKKYNKGESISFYIRDHHPESAIIDRELWDKVQAKLKEREPSEELKAKHSNRYWSSGKVFCGCCGGRYVAYQKKQKYTPYRAWMCFEAHSRGNEKERVIGGEKVKVGCNSKRVNDRVLQMAIRDILTEIIRPNADRICNDIIEQLQVPREKKDYTKQIKAKKKSIDELENKIALLTDKHLSGDIPQTSYDLTNKMYSSELEQLHREINELRAESIKAQETQTISDDYIQQIRELVNLSDDKINENLYERITKKIIVHPKQVLEIYLSFLPTPIKMQYEIQGKGKTYKAIFTIL